MTQVLMSLLMMILNYMIMFMVNPMSPGVLESFPVTMIASAKRESLSTYDFAY